MIWFVYDGGDDFYYEQFETWLEAEMRAESSGMTLLGEHEVTIPAEIPLPGDTVQ